MNTTLTRAHCSTIDKFFQPNSIVVIGVSLKRLNLGQIILTNNVNSGYKGSVYGIGSEAGELSGARIFTDVKDLPEVPDVAIIITPADTVPGLLRACGEKGIRHAVIESGGFSEFSRDNVSLEDEVLSIARHYGIRLVGPNCIGTINTEAKLFMPFAVMMGTVPVGPLSIITQSGGVGDSILRIAVETHIHFNKFVAVGNKLDLDEVDFFEYYSRDEATTSIFMYLEGFSRGRDFFEVAMRADKPVVVLKSNRTPLSAKIAQSHTAALSASDDVVSSALHQAGVIRVKSEDELIMAARMLQLPAMKGPRVAVLSRSGGHAVLTVDACARYGFELVPFPDEFIQKIRGMYHTRVIAHQNPLDLGEIFDYTIFIRILEAALELPGVDGVIFNHLYQSSYEAAMSRTFLDGVAELVRRFQKPVVVTLVSDADEILDIQKNNPFPTFTTPLQSTRALYGSLYYHRRREARLGRGVPPTYPVDRAAIDAIAARCRAEGRIPLTDEALAVAAAGGITAMPALRLRDAAELHGASIAYPAAVKLLSRDATHKSDIGGVRLGIRSAAEAERAMAEIAAAAAALNPAPRVEGYLLQTMAPRGEEFFVGARRDPVFGPVVLAGFGGIFIEVLKDVAIRVAPVTEREAREMLEQLRMYPLIAGVRGRAPLDDEALVGLICRVAHLAVCCPDIAEMDLNPVIVHERGYGASVVDARVFFTVPGLPGGR